MGKSKARALDGLRPTGSTPTAASVRERGYRRSRGGRAQQPSPSLNVDVAGVFFVALVVVFVAWPMAQFALEFFSRDA